MFPCNCLMRTFNGFLLGSMTTPCSIKLIHAYAKPIIYKSFIHQPRHPLKTLVQEEHGTSRNLLTWRGDCPSRVLN